MAQKPKVAFYWCASCGGCEEAVVDLNEEILNVVATRWLTYLSVVGNSFAIGIGFSLSRSVRYVNASRFSYG